VWVAWDAGCVPHRPTASEFDPTIIPHPEGFVKWKISEQNQALAAMPREYARTNMREYLNARTIHASANI